MQRLKYMKPILLLLVSLAYVQTALAQFDIPKKPATDYQELLKETKELITLIDEQNK